MASRSTARWCMAGSNSSMQPLPLALAVYMARSALRSSSSGRGGGPAAGGDADARPGVHLAAVDHDRLVQGVEDPLGDLDHGLGVGGVLEEHGELVAAEPGRRVAGAQAAAQPVGHRPQQLVAGAVARGCRSRA